MPARDRLHDIVKAALIKDGWTITHDPYKLQFGERDVYTDLGAERALAAERAGEKIAVEVKSFLGASPVTDLERALGQFVLYRSLMQKSDPNRKLILAMPEAMYRSLLGDVDGSMVVENVGLSLITINAVSGEIVRWVK